MNEIKTDGVLISEYQKRFNQFCKKLRVLRKRNRTLAHYIYLHAYSLGALPYPEIPHFSPSDYLPKRGKWKNGEVTFPIKLIQEALKCSHRHAQVLHLAGVLEEEVNELFRAKLKEVEKT